MHDCPTCKVPLHGHELICPSCGAKQRVKLGSSKMFGGESAAQKPSMNLMPFAVVGLVTLGIAGYLLKDSWIGQLMNRPPQVEDPIAKMTYLEARNFVESKISEGVTATGGKATFKWKRGGADVDKASEGPVEAESEVTLADPNTHTAIVDPVKPYFEKAGIKTFEMKNLVNGKVKQTWTSNVTPGVAPADGSAPAAPTQ